MCTCVLPHQGQVWSGLVCLSVSVCLSNSLSLNLYTPSPQARPPELRVVYRDVTSRFLTPLYLVFSRVIRSELSRRR